MWHNPINITVLVRPFFLLQLGIHYSSEDFFFVALVPRGTTDYNLDRVSNPSYNCGTTWVGVWHINEIDDDLLNVFLFLGVFALDCHASFCKLPVHDADIYRPCLSIQHVDPSLF